MLLSFLCTIFDELLLAVCTGSSNTGSELVNVTHRRSNVLSSGLQPNLAYTKPSHGQALMAREAMGGQAELSRSSAGLVAAKALLASCTVRHRILGKSY